VSAAITAIDVLVALIMTPTSLIGLELQRERSIRISAWRSLYVGLVAIELARSFAWVHVKQIMDRRLASLGRRSLIIKRFGRKGELRFPESLS
jgi:hypothetical protein